MTVYPFTTDPDDRRPPMGLIVLQVDETLEREMHALLGDAPPVYVSRIPSGLRVTPETLGEMAGHLGRAADLLPKARSYGVVGYACTSAAAVIGSDRVAALVRQTCDTAEVTDPLRAAISCARHHRIERLALLSPYIAEVNEPLRARFAAAGLSTEVFGTFAEAEEAKVARISRSSIVEAACDLCAGAEVDGIFLSCTNLRTLEAIPEIEQRINKPVMSSNQALCWHMGMLAKQASTF
jgi:maleate isomerase